MTGIILHNYPQSPVAEKVRAAFGIKGLAWSSVEIPRLPPKPMLTRLTGGYRRTPVMQIGAEIFCDSQRILRELERRFPEPSLFPADDEGAQWMHSRWVDGPLFSLAVKLVLGSAGDALPRDFAEDRGRLYLGPDWAGRLARANADLPHLAAQMRSELRWVERELADGRRFLTGEAPSMLDAQIHHVVWFITGRWEGGAALLAPFSNLTAWAERMVGIGHGDPAVMDAAEAIAIAAASEPDVAPTVDENDPQGLRIGANVVISPDVDGGEQPVAGRIAFADAVDVAISRTDDEAGALVVHFPRAGYRIDPV